MSAISPERINVVIINDFAHINGGTALVALSSAKALADLGYKIYLFSAVKPIADDIQNSAVTVICTDQREILTDPNRLRAIRQGVWNSEAKRACGRLLDELPPESTVVHVHGWTKSLSSSVIRMAIDKGFPVVCTLHDYFIACPNGGFFDYGKNTICPLRAMSFACMTRNCDKYSYSQKLWRVIRQIAQQMRGKIPKSIRHFIYISDFSLNVLKPYLPHNAHTYFVSNPIFVDNVEPVDPGKNSRFLAISRFSPEKGLSLLAGAAQNVQVPLTIVGDGELRGQMENEFPEIKYTGWLDRDSVNRQIREARALVLPSLWYETQGLVVAEAAAHGVPTIVPDTCAAREMVIDGKTGLWFAGGDKDDLAKKIDRLKDDGFARKLGRNAYDTYWAEPPTMRKHIDLLLKTYRQILEK